MATIDNIPEHTILDVCSEGVMLNTWTLRRIFDKILKAHYRQASNFGQVPKEFKKWVWSEDDKSGTLDIELDHKIDNWKIEQRPAIFVGLGNYTYDRKVIDNYLESREDMAGKYRVKWAKTQLIVAHKARHSDEALVLGEITKGLLNAIREPLRDSLRIGHFEVNGINAPQQIKMNGDTHYHVVTSADMIYSDAWVANTESHVIKRINVGGKSQTC